MANWPKDTQAARNAFYGNPAKGEISSQLVPVIPPFKMYYEGKRVNSIKFHREAAPALLAALNEIWDACGRDQKKADAAGVSKYAGAYNHRLVRGSKTKWSNHAYGTAIDLNPDENGLGVAKGTMPQFVVDAFCRQGAMWGGWFKSRPDWMHFEFVDNGGRKPQSPPPVWPGHGLFSEPAALTVGPLDDIEPAPAALPPFLVPGDPDVASVQTRLKAMNYSPGLIDGKWGSNTSGAIAAFLNDRQSPITAPTSREAFASSLDDIKEELADAEADKFVRPVSQARASADSATVAKVAPEVVPVKTNEKLGIFGGLSALFFGFIDYVKDSIAAAWSFFTDNRDSIDPSWVTTATGYVSSIPPIVWILGVAGLFGWMYLNSRKAVAISTTSVQTGARQ